MSFTKNTHKIPDKPRIDCKQADLVNCEEDQNIKCQPTESCTYAVTVSKKSSTACDEESRLCAGQKSFISIHSTDHLCQVTDANAPSSLQECNVEVLSLNEVFPSTSEESLSNDDESPVHNKHKNMKKNKNQGETAKSPYVPSNSKSSTGSGRVKEQVDAQAAGYSDFDIPKNTMYVIGSNPGEPKMSYPDPPKKMSKTMKKLIRNIDKHKADLVGVHLDKKKFITRGILKDGRCAPECTGDSTIQGGDEYDINEELIPFSVDEGPQTNYNKQNPDKNVKFNTQVVIIHFTGDICLGQSVETLSKEKDQQARNSELRKTFLTKYNELWSTQK